MEDRKQNMSDECDEMIEWIHGINFHFIKESLNSIANRCSSKYLRKSVAAPRKLWTLSWNKSNFNSTSILCQALPLRWIITLTKFKNPNIFSVSCWRDCRNSQSYITLSKCLPLFMSSLLVGSITNKRSKVYKSFIWNLTLRRSRDGLRPFHRLT